MKAPVLGLSIAVAAFAGSSLYLWQQLQVERERSAQVEMASRQLHARVAELEKSQTVFAHVRGNNTSVIRGAFGAGPPQPGVSRSVGAAGPEKSETPWVAAPHPRTPAMDKMMRWQVRADHKRMYAGAGEALGLSKDATGKLIDLLTEQQMAQFNSFADLPWTNDRAEAQRRVDEQRRQNEAAIQELLGPEKAQALQEYQQSLPARQEFEMLVNQLEGNDVTLTPEQNKKLLAVYLEERKRVPMPNFAEVPDPSAYQEAYSAWQQEYSSRVADEARRILDSNQLNAFNEVQESQKEMRAQFSTVTFATSGPLEAGVAMRATPMAVAAGAEVTLIAPPPKDQQERRD